MKNILTAFIISGMIGCSSIPMQTISFDREILKVPELNQISSQELGDTLLEYRVLASSPSWKIKKEYITKKNIAGVYHIIHPQVVKPTAVDEEGTKYFNASQWSAFGGLSPNGRMAGELRGNFTYKGLCFLIMRSECLDSEYIETAEYIDLSQPNIKQQLIYNGRVGDYVKFLYREISEGAYLRQPFTQEIQYDLNEGKLIGFKGTRIEVIDATNRQITYKVLKHFDPIL